jgi:site-specific DNA recombinase
MRGKGGQNEVWNCFGFGHFAEMLRRIEAGEASGIIAWHPDRLARNSRDGGEIIYLLDTGKLRDLKFVTFWFENSPQGKCMLGHEFVQTKQYSDKLACDTRRGLQQKASTGIFPGYAPIGYMNQKATKTIAVDRQTAPIVKRAFEVYAEGNRTLDKMQEYFAENGILSRKRNRWTKGGLKVHHNWIRRFLRNPFYYGHFEYAGELYEGKHEPIISKSLFDQVQAVLERRTHHYPVERQPKAFVGLFHCAECGMSITAEVQKGHTYYRCTKKSKTATKCTQPFVREEDLDRQLSAMLSEFVLSEDLARQMLAMIEDERKDLASSSRALMQEKRAEFAQINVKSQRLVEAYLEQLIDCEMFALQKKELLSKKKTLQDQIELCEANRPQWLEPLQNWVETAKNMEKIIKTGSPMEKKTVAAQVFGSNLFLDSKKARGSSVKPWSFLLEKPLCGGVVPASGIEPLTSGL